MNRSMNKLVKTCDIGLFLNCEQRSVRLIDHGPVETAQFWWEPMEGLQFPEFRGVDVIGLWRNMCDASK